MPLWLCTTRSSLQSNSQHGRTLAAFTSLQVISPGGLLVDCSLASTLTRRFAIRQVHRHLPNWYIRAFDSSFAALSKNTRHMAAEPEPYPRKSRRHGDAEGNWACSGNGRPTIQRQGVTEQETSALAGLAQSVEGKALSVISNAEVGNGRGRCGGHLQPEEICERSMLMAQTGAR